jgi:hypothetical protein
VDLVFSLKSHRSHRTLTVLIELSPFTDKLVGTPAVPLRCGNSGSVPAPPWHLIRQGGSARVIHHTDVHGSADRGEVCAHSACRGRGEPGWPSRRERPVSPWLRWWAATPTPTRSPSSADHRDDRQLDWRLRSPDPPLPLITPPPTPESQLYSPASHVPAGSLSMALGGFSAPAWALRASPRRVLFTL